MNFSKKDRVSSSYEIYKQVHKILLFCVQELNHLLRKQVAVCPHIPWKVLFPKSSRIRFWWKLAFEFYGSQEFLVNHKEKLSEINLLPYFFVKEDLNRLKLSPEYEEKFNHLISSSKAEWILTIQDTSILGKSDRELFGFLYRELVSRKHKLQGKNSPKIVNPEQRGKVVYPQRKRGYADKGSMRIVQPLYQNSEDKNELVKIEEKRLLLNQKIQEDITDLRRGGLG